MKPYVVYSVQMNGGFMTKSYNTKESADVRFMSLARSTSVQYVRLLKRLGNRVARLLKECGNPKFGMRRYKAVQ